MRKQDGLYAGWVESSIGDLLRADGQFATRFEYMLITSIDSSTDLSTLPEAKEIARRYPSLSVVGTSLLLPSSQAAQVSGAFKLFTGFDEVWWFDEQPSTPKPSGVSLVAPLNVSIEGIPPGVVQWVQESNCRVGLGDGIGLNFVTPDPALAGLVERIAAV